MNRFNSSRLSTKGDCWSMSDHRRLHLSSSVALVLVTFALLVHLPVANAAGTNTESGTDTTTMTPASTPSASETSTSTISPASTPSSTDNTRTISPSETSTVTPVPTSSSTDNTGTISYLGTNTASSSNTATPLPTKTATVSSIPTETQSNSGQATSSATISLVPTETLSNSGVPSTTATISPIPTGTRSDTGLPTNTATNSEIGSQSDSQTITPAPTGTATDSATNSLVETRTLTQLTGSGSESQTSSPVETQTASSVATATGATVTPSGTQVITPPETKPPTSTESDSMTITPVPTGTDSGTATASPVDTKTASSVATSTGSPTPTATEVETPAGTKLPTATESDSMTITPVPTGTVSGSVTASPVKTQTVTTALTSTATISSAPTSTPTQTAPLTETQTLSSVKTRSATSTAPETRTGDSPSVSTTITPAETRSETTTITPPPTSTATNTRTVSPPPTQTAQETPSGGFPRNSATDSITESDSLLPTVTGSISVVPTQSATDSENSGSRSETITPAGTDTPSPTETLSPPDTNTAQGNTRTGGEPAVATGTDTISESDSEIPTATNTHVGTGSEVPTRTDSSTSTYSAVPTDSETLSGETQSLRTDSRGSGTPTEGSGTPSLGSGTRSDVSPSPTDTITPAATETGTATLPDTVTKGTISETESKSPVETDTATDTAATPSPSLDTLSKTGSVSEVPTSTDSQGTASPTQPTESLGTETRSKETVSGRTPSQGTPSPTQSFTISATPPITATPSDNTFTKTGGTESFTPSLTKSLTPSFTLTPSITTTLTPTESFTEVPTRPPTDSVSTSFTPPETATSTFSRSITHSVTPSFTKTPGTFSYTPSDITESPTDTYTKTLSLTPTPGTPSSTPSVSGTLSETFTHTQSLTESVTISKSTTISKTVSHYSPSFTKSATISATKSITESLTGTISSTATISQTHTDSLTRTFSGSSSATSTVSVTVSDSVTQSLSGTSSVTGTFSLPETETVSVSGTFTISESAGTISMSMGTLTISGSVSVTESLPLTTSVMPPTSSPVPTPTRSLPTACPDEGAGCDRGECIASTTHAFWMYCKCFNNPNQGYWTNSGADGPCDRCKAGYYGQRCDRSCPGGSCSTCGGHGICDDGKTGKGTCTCFNSPQLGNWSGTSCTDCQPGWYGSDCTSRCLCITEGLESCNDGRFGDGRCNCKEGWSGDLCSTCDPAIVPLCLNRQRCPGDPVCNGQGVCREVLQQNKIVGFCECNATWATADCGVQCPQSPGGDVCNGHGVCLDGRERDGSCSCNGTFAPPDCAECQSGYWGTDCDQICPGGVNNPCNNNGTCQRDGTCACNGIYGGTGCTIPCPRDSNGICGGHGICDSTPQCLCFSNDTYGYWQTTPDNNCGECDNEHGGPECKIACPKVNVGGSLEVCNGVTAGFCNKTDGTCSCLGNQCGRQCVDILVDLPGGAKDCKSCELPRQWGENCEFNCSCVNVDPLDPCNDGKGGDGTCFCLKGWMGPQCEKQCPGGVSNPCNSQGTCNPVTESCECFPGYAGEECNIECPGLNNSISCSGHGTCNDTRTGDGTCTCQDDWAWPVTGCDTPCDCNRHGVCPYRVDKVAECACFGNYDGASCDGCKPGWSALDCQTPCINGTTDGYVCRCDEGFGGPSCDIECPRGLDGLICSGKGMCDNVTGTCQCDELRNDHMGPACQCSFARCQASFNQFFTCNRTDGECICLLNRAGSDCRRCVEGKWGASCTQACPCNDRGSCDQNTGKCSCDFSSELGFWGGAACDVCADGFMPPDCIQKSIRTAIMAPLQLLQNSRGTLTYTYLDKSKKLLYAGGNPSHAIWNLNDTQSIEPAVKMNVQKSSLLDPNATEIPAYIYYAQPNVYNNSEWFYVSQSNFSRSVNVTMWKSNETEFLDELELYDDNLFYTDVKSIKALISNEQDTIHRSALKVFKPGEFFFCYQSSNNGARTFCRFNNESIGLSPLIQAADTVQGRMQDMQWSEKQSAMLTAGLSYNSPPDCGLYFFNVDGSLKDPQPYDINGQFFNLTCQYLDCTFEQGDAMYFGARTVASVNGQTVSQNFLGRLNLTSGNITGLTLSGRDICSDITFIPSLRVGLATFGQTLVKFEERDITATVQPSIPSAAGEYEKIFLEVYGVQILSAAPSQLVLYEEEQTVFGPIPNANGLEIFRFYLVEVLTVAPLLANPVGVADRLGGTTVTVNGRGFKAGPGALCRFGQAQVPATVLDENTLTCVAPQAITSETCLQERLEVSMNGLVFTQNNVLVDRPESVLHESISPRRIRVGSRGETFTVNGRGIVESSVATCRFTDTSLAQPKFVPAVFKSNPSRYECTIAEAFSSPTTSAARLSISLDGQIYPDGLKFAVVGAPAGIQPSLSTVTNRTAAIVTFDPPVQVFTVDERGNLLSDFDTEEKVVTVTHTVKDSSVLDTRFFFEPVKLIDGVASLSSLTLFIPASGKHEFIITASANTSAPTSTSSSTTRGLALQQTVSTVWTIPLTVSVSFGDLQALKVSIQPYYPAAGEYVVPQAIMPSKTEITVIDLAGNAVPSADGILINVTQATLDHLDDVIMEYPAAHAEFNPILVNGQGVATLERLPFIGGFGWRYVYFFAVSTDININVTTIEINPRCDKTHFWVWNETECQVCKTESTFCNGTDILVAKEGYWRPDPTSLEFYKCPQKNVCAQGAKAGDDLAAAEGDDALAAPSPCIEGYEGPLCSVCSPGYGRGFRGECLKCKATWINALQLLAIAIAFYLVLSGFLIVTIQNWRSVKSRAGKAMVIVQIGVLYMQSASLMEFLDLSWPTRVKNLFSFIGMLADFRVSAIEASNCALRGVGVQQPDMALIYLGFFFLVPLLSWTTWFLLKRKPGILMSTDAKERRMKDMESQKKLDLIKKKKVGHDGNYIKEHQRKTIVLVAFQVVLTFVFQSAVLNHFRIIPCKNVVISKELTLSYLEADMSVSCDSTYYKTFEYYGYVLSGALAMGIPVVILFFVGWMRALYIENYFPLYAGFFKCGLKDENFYWISLVFVRKSILCAIVVFFSYPLDAYFYIWAMSGFAGVQLYLKPYDTRRHNILDSVGMFSIVVTANLALIFKVTPGDDALHEGLVWVLLIIQAATYIAFIAEFLRLWIWKPLQDRRKRKVQDDAVEPEESTTKIKERLQREEDLAELDPVRLIRQKTFADVMTLREKSRERTLSYANKGEVVERNGTAFDLPDLDEEELDRIEREEKEAMKQRQENEAAFVYEPKLHSEAKVKPKKKMLMKERMNADLEDLSRDVDDFLGVDNTPAHFKRLSNLPSFQRKDTNVSGSVVQRQRPVALEEMNRKYLARLEAERSGGPRPDRSSSTIAAFDEVATISRGDETMSLSNPIDMSPGDRGSSSLERGSQSTEIIPGVGGAKDTPLNLEGEAALAQDFPPTPGILLGGGSSSEGAPSPIMKDSSQSPSNMSRSFNTTANMPPVPPSLLDLGPASGYSAKKKNQANKNTSAWPSFLHPDANDFEDL